jgi:hypothetical protein
MRSISFMVGRDPLSRKADEIARLAGPTGNTYSLEPRPQKPAHLGAEPFQFLFRKQLMGLDGEESLNGHRPSHIIERVGHLPLALLDSTEYIDIPFVTALVRIGSGPLDLIERAPAESLERNRMELAQDLPVGFLDFA